MTRRRRSCSTTPTIDAFLCGSGFSRELLVRSPSHLPTRADHAKARGQSRSHEKSPAFARRTESAWRRSDEHTSELQSLMRISYAGVCLKKQKCNMYDIVEWLDTYHYNIVCYDIHLST